MTCVFALCCANIFCQCSTYTGQHFPARNRQTHKHDESFSLTCITSRHTDYSGGHFPPPKDTIDFSIDGDLLDDLHNIQYIVFKNHEINGFFLLALHSSEMIFPKGYKHMNGSDGLDGPGLKDELFYPPEADHHSDGSGIIN
jgi:hypothetical protein